MSPPRSASDPAATRPAVVRLETVDSTQTVAFALADGGAPAFTTVVADTQSEGRGRRGRVWRDEPGTALLASVVLRPRLPAAVLPTLSLATAVAVAEAVERTAGVTPRLKWPNDVLLEGRKVAGILLESRLGGEIVAVAGIGVNLTQRAFPPELAARATSILLATGRTVDRDALLTALVPRLQHWVARLETQGFAPVGARWRALAETLGRRVAIDGIEGTAVDVDGDGALLVSDGARVHRVLAGDVAEAP